jgi:hypothetical protein
MRIHQILLAHNEALRRELLVLCRSHSIQLLPTRVWLGHYGLILVLLVVASQNTPLRVHSNPYKCI